MPPPIRGGGTREYHGPVNKIALIAAFVVLANLGCILSWNRAQRALRDLGAIWVRALAGRRYSSSH